MFRRRCASRDEVVGDLRIPASMTEQGRPVIAAGVPTAFAEALSFAHDG
jgi:hypothetical protein